MANEVPSIPFDDFAKRLEPIFDEMAHQHQPVLIERQGRTFRLEPHEVKQPQPGTPPAGGKGTTRSM